MSLKTCSLPFKRKRCWVYRKDDFTFDNLCVGEIYPHFLKRKTLIKVIGAIILCIPSFFLGTLLKGMAQLTFSARERHRWAAIHCDKIPRKDIQTETGSMEEIKTKLFDPYQRKVDVLIIQGNKKHIGPDDTIGLNHIEIGKKLILINTAITNGLKMGTSHVGAEEALRFQGFENAKFRFSPSDAQAEAEPLKLLRPVHRQNKIIGCVEYTYTHERGFNQEQTILSTLEEYQAKEKKFLEEQTIKNKRCRDTYFNKHPLGLIGINFGQTSLGEYLVKDIDSALQNVLPKNSKRVYIVEN